MDWEIYRILLSEKSCRENDKAKKLLQKNFRKKKIVETLGVISSRQIGD